MRILVTGATGFVGRALCEALSVRGHYVRAGLRTARSTPAFVAEDCVVGDISESTDWDGALSGIDAVVHIAARVHVLYDGRGGYDQYMRTNALGTRRLAEQAARARIGRLLFLSSVKVNGEESCERFIHGDGSPETTEPLCRVKMDGGTGLE